MTENPFSAHKAVGTIGSILAVSIRQYRYWKGCFFSQPHRIDDLYSVFKAMDLRRNPDKEPSQGAVNQSQANQCFKEVLLL